MIRKQTGISIDIESAPDKTKFQTMMASGDLPDIIMVQDLNNFKPLIEGNLIIPLDDLLAANGKDIVQNVPQMLKYSKDYQSLGKNETYFLFGNVDTSPITMTSQVGPYMRWDYYKELGYPAIKNGDDWLNVVAEMVKKHPTNAEGKKVYGFSPWFDWGTWYFGLVAQIENGLAGTGDVINLYSQTDLSTQNLRDVPIEEMSILNGAEFFYKANKMGLLDPDSLTQKYDNALAKFAANRVMSGVVNWPYDPPNAEFLKEGKKDSGYMPIAFQTDSWYIGNPGPLGTIGKAFAISKTSKHPDRALQLLNYLYSYDGSRTIMNGIKDVNYKDVNGKPAMTPETIKSMQTDANFAVSSGVGKYINLIGLGTSNINPADNQPVDLTSTSEAFKAQLTPLYQDYSAHYGVDYPAEAMSKQLKFKYLDASTAGLQPTAPDDIVAIKAKVDEYMKNALVKLVLSKDDAAFAAGKKKFIADIKNLGVDKAYAFDKSALTEALAKRAELEK
ncbi:unnamed protein product [Aphanomyces euteiches]